MNTELENIESSEKIEIPQNVKVEKMRYQKNSLSYMLGFAGIGFSIFAAFILLNSLTPDIYTIFKILLNIVILLFGFMCCENVKNYREKSAYMMLGIAGVCVARIFFGPVMLFKYYSKYLTFMEDGILQTDENTIVSKWLGSSIIDKSGFLTSTGYVRAILAIIGLIGAALCFIFAAIICIRKSKVLKKFLAENK